jgi:Rad3-related DNA helicase
MASAAVTLPLGPATVNITGVRAGDLNEFTVVVTQAGQAIDLTGYVPSAHARKLPTDPEPAIVAVVEILDAAAGRMVVRFPGDQVMETLAGQATWAGHWDLQIMAGDEDPITLLAGTLGAVMDVTRP